MVRKRGQNLIILGDNELPNSLFNIIVIHFNVLYYETKDPQPSKLVNITRSSSLNQTFQHMLRPMMEYCVYLVFVRAMMIDQLTSFVLLNLAELDLLE